MHLAERLARVRRPEALDGPGWEDGTSSAYLRELVGWWRTGFDWRAQGAAINRFSHFRATVDGVGLHFVHERGSGPAPLPLVLTGHGGEEADAFDVVIPSLPGYRCSGPLQGRGSANRVSKLWAELMTDVLGYGRSPRTSRTRSSTRPSRTRA